MVTERISTNDIQNIGAYGRLVVTLPSYAACLSTKTMVTYTKNMYPRKDGLTYSISIDRDTNTITISTIDKQ